MNNLETVNNMNLLNPEEEFDLITYDCDNIIYAMTSISHYVNNGTIPLLEKYFICKHLNIGNKNTGKFVRAYISKQSPDCNFYLTMQHLFKLQPMIYIGLTQYKRINSRFRSHEMNHEISDPCVFLLAKDIKERIRGHFLERLFFNKYSSNMNSIGPMKIETLEKRGLCYQEKKNSFNRGVYDKYLLVHRNTKV